MSVEGEVTEGTEESNTSFSCKPRHSSPLLESPATSEDEGPTSCYAGRRYHSNSESSIGRLELVGCAACGECFESAEDLVDHQEHRCIGLLSETEGEDESAGFVLPPRALFACPKCPDLNFNGRCELIRHLKGHRQRGFNKGGSRSKANSSSIWMKQICVCRRRPCRCPPRSLKKRKSAGHDVSEGGTLCNGCFAGKLSLGREAGMGAKTCDTEGAGTVGVCMVCSSAAHRSGTT